EHLHAGGHLHRVPRADDEAALPEPVPRADQGADTRARRVVAAEEVFALAPLLAEVDAVGAGGLLLVALQQDRPAGDERDEAARPHPHLHRAFGPRAGLERDALA